MKIEFEKWLDAQPEVTGNSREIFDDAVKCFKNGIYRPALMLSYVGFLFIVRSRILVSDAPEGFNEQEWNSIKSDVRNEEKWEKKLSEKLQQKEQNSSNYKAAPFFISDDIRKQIEYWKDRRNDCAHYKNNDIGESHVLSFWLFLKSKLPHIQVNGGVQSLIDKFEIFYDISKTPADTDISHLLCDLSLIIAENNYQELFHKIIKITYGLHLGMRMKMYHPYYDDNTIKPYFIKYINDPSKEDFRWSFLSSKPTAISEVLEPAEIREFWYSNIAGTNNVLPVYAEMLNAEMIPINEIPEANEKILECLYNNCRTDHIDKLQQYILINSGIYDIFVKKYLDHDYLKWHYFKLNSKVNFYISMIDQLGVNIDAVKAICNNFNDGNYPYAIKNEIINLLGRTTNLANQFRDIANSNNINIPPEYNL